MSSKEPETKESSLTHESDREGSQTSVSSPAAHDRTSGQINGWRLHVVQFCLFFGLLLSVIDSTIVSTALIDIGEYFDDFAQLQWVPLAYMLTYLGFAIIFPRASDAAGRKWTYIAAFLQLTAFSLGCGLAQTLNQLIAFRALQGVGGAGLYAMAMITLPEITPTEKFALMSGLIGVVFAVTGILGPVLGGVITTHSTWRWCFLLNVPCGVVAMVVVLFVWPKTDAPGRIKWKQLDYVGCLLYVGPCVLLVFALQEAGAGAYAWDSVTIIASLVFAAVGGGACAFWLWFFSRRPQRLVAPLFHTRIVTHRVLFMTLLISVFVGYIYYDILIVLPQRFQIVNGKSPQAAGIALLPMSGASGLGSGLGGALNSRRNNTLYTAAMATGLCLLGAGLLYSVAPTQDIPAKLYGFQVLLGVGFGTAFSTTTVLTKLHAEPEDNASAQGLLAQFRILGGNIGLAVATIVLNSHFEADLRDVLPASTIRALRQSLNVVATLTREQQAAVAESFARSFQTQLIICAVLGGCGLLASVATWQRRPPSFQEWQEKQAAADAAAAAEKDAKERGETNV